MEKSYFDDKNMENIIDFLEKTLKSRGQLSKQYGVRWALIRISLQNNPSKLHQKSKLHQESEFFQHRFVFTDA